MRISSAAAHNTPPTPIPERNVAASMALNISVGRKLRITCYLERLFVLLLFDRDLFLALGVLESSHQLSQHFRRCLLGVGSFLRL